MKHIQLIRYLFVLILCSATFGVQDCLLDHQTPKRKAVELNPQDSDELKRSRVDDSEESTFDERSRDMQIRSLSTKSEFVEGDSCARLRWVEDLDIFSASISSPTDYTQISADIHGRLAYIGNHLRAFAAQYPQDDRYPFNRNILIPHVSFVVTRSYDDVSTKLFIPGSYLNFDEEKFSDSALAFISGRDSMPWSALQHYNTYRRKHNTSKQNPFDLPLIRVLCGGEVEKKIGKELSYEEDASSSPQTCKYHTEEMLYEMLLANPGIILEQAQKVLWPIDKIEHVIFDLFSWWDVCRPCQTRFRTEYFTGEFHTLLESEFESSDYDFSPHTGLLPVFRFSSYKQYHSDSLINMADAGGGSAVKSGLEAKVVSQIQVVLATRKSQGVFDYPSIVKRTENY